jgi:hypothetical protein
MDHKLYPQKYAERRGILIGYRMIAPASSGYSSKFRKILQNGDNVANFFGPWVTFGVMRFKG